MDKERLVKKKLRAKRDGNTRQFADATNDLADLYFEAANFGAALEEYSELVEACEALGDRLNGAIAHRMIGEIHATLCEYERALEHQKLYLEGAKEVENKVEEQRALATLGRTYFCLAESLPENSQDRTEALADARKAYNASITLCTKLTTKDIPKEELMMMRGRLLLNQGQVLEAQAEPEAGIDLIKQAIKICSKHKLNEDLHRAHLALGALHERQGNVDLALEHLSLAAKVESASTKGNALLAKAELLLRRGEWTEARKVLVGLYQDKKLPKTTREQLEKLLRIAVTLCRGEERLNSEDPDPDGFRLCEDLGDAAAAAGCYHKALGYYQGMLSHAEKMGSEKGIAAALFSLAQTSKDAGRCEEALAFGQRELNLCSDPKEACRSALFLATLSESVGSPSVEICRAYKLALEKAEASENPSLEATVLKDYLDHLENEGSEDAEGIKARLNLLLETIPELDSEKESSENPDIGADIDLDDLSDLEQTGDQRPRPVRPTSTRRKGFAIKSNEKGETPLHVACINGSIERVEKLLEAGHPTAVRDNCGWTPLHEAANHGFVEIARLLIGAGAKIDDPGGAECGGITPLHDAAACGNVAVMNLLIDKGADIYAKTREGETTLDSLEAWRERAKNLSEADENEYKYIRKKLSDRGVQRRREKRPEKRTGARDLSDLIDEDEDRGTESANISAGEDYKRTIAVLRNRGAQANPSKSSATQKSLAPLIDSEEVLEEEWLDDDMGVNLNRTTNGLKDPLETTAKRKSGGLGVAVERESKRQRTRMEDGVPASIFDEDDSSDSVSIEMSVGEPEKINKKKKRQSSLLSAGFSRLSASRTPSPSLEILDIGVPLQSQAEGISLQVLVEDKLFKLRLGAKEGQKITGERIVDETRRIFQEDTGCTPTFDLLAPDGDPISPQDDLEALLQPRSELTLHSRLKKMDVPPISERYRKICSTCNVGVEEGTIKCLKTCENTSIFRLRGRETLDEEISPLLKSLEYQIRLQVLYLSQGSFNSCGKMLSRCLANLASLQELHLRCSDVDALCLSRVDKLPLQIRVLDLSYNPLGRASGTQLHRLLSPLKNLQTLSLRSCGLEDIPQGTTTPALTNLDVSWNPLDGEALRSLLQPHMLSLNLSGTRLKGVELLSHPGFSLATLETLEVASCNLGDPELSQILLQTSNLSRIVASGNPGLTEKSVAQILRRKPGLAYVDVSGCSEVVQPPDLEDIIPGTLNLVISMKPEVRQSWLQLWRGEAWFQALPHRVVNFKSS